MKYKAMFLDDEEFESLPYKDMEFKIGVADPKTGTAYARKSGIPVIDAFTIMHELEHLEEGHGGEHADHFDPEHGVYYKGFGNLFSAIGGGLSNIGGGLARGASSIGGGLSNIGGAFSRGAGAVSRGVGGLFGGSGGQSPMGGALNKPVGQGGITIGGANGMGSMGGVAGGYSAQPFAQSGGPSSPLTLFAPRGSGSPGIPGQVHPGVRFPTTGSFTPKSATSQSGMMDSINKLFPRGGPSFNLNLGGGGGGSPQPTPQVAPQQTATPAPQVSGASTNPIKSIFGENANLGQVGAGTALAGFGQLASPKVNLPNLAELPNVQALQNMNFRNFQELDPALVDATNRDFDMIDARERDRLISTYKSLRPGADIESDSSYRRDIEELQRMQGMRRADSLAKYRFEYLSKQLQMSELEMRQMTELAYMDIATIMLKLGVDAQTAQDFKAAFSGIGSAMVSSGLGINQEQPANANQPA